MKFWLPAPPRPIVIAVALALAAVPAVGARVLLSISVAQSAQASVTETAGQMVERAEATIDESLDALTDLAMAGVTRCGPDELALLRSAAYANYSLKEIGITDASGQIICNHLGDDVPVKALSPSLPSSRNGNVTIQVVQLRTDLRKGIMMTWAFDQGGGLSGVVPAELAVPDFLASPLRQDGYGRVTLTDGTLIRSLPVGETGRTTGAGGDQAGSAGLVEATASSRRYPLTASFAAPLASFEAEASRLTTSTGIGSVILGIVIFGLILFAYRRRPGEAETMRRAVERGEFIPYYQPVINMDDGSLLGCEVLIRWRKPNGRIVPPGAFIALAEATGLAMPMTRSLMMQARNDLDEAYGARPELKLSINLFGGHFESLRIVDEVRTIFGGSRIRFSQLVLEMTERQPVSDIDRARAVIRRLRRLGARVALDDAGTGHSGLANLQTLGLDVLKIDKLFVDSIGTIDGTSPIIDSLIRLGHDLDMEVIAEGVETVEQVRYLRARGVQGAQGYLFSRPIPAASYLALVRATAPGASQQNEAKRPPPPAPRPAQKAA